MEAKKMAILCLACKADTFVRREPVYEGFRKTGERIFCMSCGHEYASEGDVPYTTTAKPTLFTDADRSKRVEVFRNDEKGRNCRHCRHFVVNPFIQRCGRRHVEVQATDCCDDFQARSAVATETECDPLQRKLDQLLSD